MSSPTFGRRKHRFLDGALELRVVTRANLFGIEIHFDAGRSPAFARRKHRFLDGAFELRVVTGADLFEIEIHFDAGCDARFISGGCR